MGSQDRRAALGIHELALGFRYRSPQRPRRLNPFSNYSFSIRNSFLVGLAVRHTTWQLGHFNNKTVIVLAPVDDKFIPAVHDFSPASLYLTIRLRTCLT